MPECILIVGLDGSGKTTQTKMLMHGLANRNIKTRYVYARGYSRVFFTLPLLCLSRMLGFTKLHSLRNGIRVSEYLFYFNSAFRRIWIFFSFIDSVLYCTVLFWIKSLLSDKLIISDRSVIDTLVDIISDTQLDETITSYEKFFINLIPKNSIVIYLDIKETTALKRKKDILDFKYLEKRRKLYEFLVKKYNWRRIDANLDFNEVYNNLLSILDLGLTYDL